MRRSVASVVDVATQNAAIELGMLIGMGKSRRLLAVVGDAEPRPSDLPPGQLTIRRSSSPLANQPTLLREFDSWFRRVAEDIQPQLAEEPLRLLEARQYRAAVVSAVTHLEAVFRSALEKDEKALGRTRSLSALADIAASHGVLTKAEHQRMRSWMRVRNSVVHSGET